MKFKVIISTVKTDVTDSIVDAAKKAGILHLAISTRYEDDSVRLP